MDIRTVEEMAALDTGTVIIERQRAISAIDKIESYYGEDRAEHPDPAKVTELEGYVAAIEKELVVRGITFETDLGDSSLFACSDDVFDAAQTALAGELGPIPESWREFLKITEEGS